MPWNEPGNNGRRPDPFGGGGNQSSPPDLDKLLGDFLRKIKGFFQFQQKGKGGNTTGTGGTNKRLASLGTIFGIIIFMWVLSGFFIVNPAEEAVILRFGRYTTTLQPGLHWIAPFIEKKYILNVQQIHSFSIDGDFLTKSSDHSDAPVVPGVGSLSDDAANSDQSKNLVNVELTVMYQISDPKAYLFHVVDPDETIKQVAAGALSEVTGTMKLDDVLTTGRELLASNVLTRLRRVLTEYDAGLEVQGVTLRKVQAPDEVRAAFNDVNRAEQDRKTSINQAQAYASKVIPLAQGAAARTLADAEGWRQQKVLQAKAAVSRYEALLKVFLTDPDVTRQRMYMDAMENVLKNTTKILVDTGSTGNVFYLPLDQLLKQAGLPPKSAATVASSVVSSGDAGGEK